MYAKKFTSYVFIELAQRFEKYSMFKRFLSWRQQRTRRHEAMKVLIALDIGSSSLRCSAYELLEDSNAVEALDGCSTQTKFRSIRPTTGRIALLLNQKAEGDDGSSSSSSLLDEIDRCVDECLKALREKHHEDGFSIVGLGFSTFVMNLVGVDENGQPVDEQATLSYACNAPLVAQECRNMKRYVYSRLLA
jgi:gluconokinase